MRFIENLKNLFFTKKNQKTKQLPKIKKEENNNDAMWILNNINNPSFKQSFETPEKIDYVEKTEIKEINEGEELVKFFMKEISKGPGRYNVKKYEDCILKAENITLNEVSCELIRNVIENQINILERKGASNHWKEEYTDIIQDLKLLFISPYSHSKLLGSNTEKINKLRCRIKELDRSYC